MRTIQPNLGGANNSSPSYTPNGRGYLGRRRSMLSCWSSGGGLIAEHPSLGNAMTARPWMPSSGSGRPNEACSRWDIKAKSSLLKLASQLIKLETCYSFKWLAIKITFAHIRLEFFWNINLIGPCGPFLHFYIHCIASFSTSIKPLFWLFDKSLGNSKYFSQSWIQDKWGQCPFTLAYLVQLRSTTVASGLCDVMSLQHRDLTRVKCMTVDRVLLMQFEETVGKAKVHNAL